MRLKLLSGLLIVASMSVAIAARQQPAASAPEPMVVQTDKLADTLYVMKGGGGNSAVFITGTGVVVVDTKNPGWGQPLLEAIRKVTGKPVTMIINTHSHGDHVSGNVEFPATVDVVTHENTRKNMEAMRPASFAAPPAGGPPPNIFVENKRRGMAKRSYKDAMTIGRGAEQIELRYFGRAHTDGDTFVVFPALRVMHTGDTFPNKRGPGIDANNGGSGVDYARTLTNAADFAEKNNIDTIINGHSDTPTTRADLREFSRFVRDYVAYAQAQKKAGRTVDDAVSAWTMPASYTGYAATTPAMRNKTNFELIYRETK